MFNSVCFYRLSCLFSPYGIATNYTNGSHSLKKLLRPLQLREFLLSLDEMMVNDTLHLPPPPTMLLIQFAKNITFSFQKREEGKAMPLQARASTHIFQPWSRF